jgi:hypothetical protein
MIFYIIGAETTMLFGDGSTGAGQVLGPHRPASVRQDLNYKRDNPVSDDTYRIQS